MNKKCAFLMSSCDTYEDLWHPFFECLDLMWEGIEWPVYLNTEHKQYIPRKELSFQVNTINQKGDKPLSWSRRFMDVLEAIPEEYVFLVLDDFFLCDKVDISKMDEILHMIEADKSIASFQLYGTRIRNAKPESYAVSEGMIYELMGKEGWKTHFVPTIWRKSVLLKWLRPWESIWAFEDCGSKRARRWNYSEKVYVVSNPPVYDYLWIKDCSAVVNSKWLAEPELIEFFQENNISIDFTKRGKMTHREYQEITTVDVMKRYSLPQIIVKVFNRIRSFF